MMLLPVVGALLLLTVALVCAITVIYAGFTDPVPTLTVLALVAAWFWWMWDGWKKDRLRKQQAQSPRIPMAWQGPIQHEPKPNALDDPDWLD